MSSRWWSRFTVVVGCLLFPLGHAAAEERAAYRGTVLEARRGLQVIRSSTGRPFPNVVRDEQTVGPLHLAPDGRLVVAVKSGTERKGLGRESYGVASLWCVDLADAVLLGAPDYLRPVPYVRTDARFTAVTDMAASRDATWVATDVGLLRVAGTQAHLYRPRWTATIGSARVRFDGWQLGVHRVEVDAAGWAWIVPRSAVGIGLCAFDTSRAEAETRVRVLRVLESPPVAIAASPRGDGVWLLLRDERGAPACVFVRGAASTKPGASLPTGPSAAASPADTARTLADDAALLKVAPGLRLSSVRAQADILGRLWVAGQDRTGVRIYRCEAEAALAELTGFQTLLAGGRITDIAVDKEGTAYFGTDAAGVLMYDGQQWQAHPINEDLPHLVGSDLKPVSYVLPLPDGGLCVCTGQYLLIWHAS